MRSQTPRSPPCLRGAPVRGAAFSPRWAQRVQARPEPSGGCWLWPKPRGWPAGPAQERRWGPEPELLVQVCSWPLSCVPPPQGSRPSRLWSKLRTAGGALVDTRRALSAGLSPATPAALHGAKATSPARPRQGSGHLPVPMEGASPFMNREKGLLGGGGPSEGAVELPSRSILPACCRNFSRSRDSRPNCSLCARHFSSSSRTRHCGRGARSQPAPGGGGARVRGSVPCPCVLRAMCACGLCARVCMCRERARVHCGHLCACRGACVCAVVRVHVSCVGQAASSLHMEQRRVTLSLPHSLAVGQVPSQASVGKRRCQEAPPARGPQPAAARSGLRVQPGHLAVGMAPAAVRNRRVRQWHGPDSGTPGC